MSERPEQEMEVWDDDDYIMEISKKQYDKDNTQSFDMGYLLGGVVTVVICILIAVASS